MTAKQPRSKENVIPNNCMYLFKTCTLLSDFSLMLNKIWTIGLLIKSHFKTMHKNIMCTHVIHIKYKSYLFNKY